MFKCENCPSFFKTKSLLNEHNRTNHTFICSYCNAGRDTLDELNKHKAEEHKDDQIYRCDLCEFVCYREGIMEDHILDKHAIPDKDNLFKCDDCDFQTTEKNNYGKHFKETHGSEAQNTGLETKNLEDKLRILKKNFERLESMYHDSLEETNKVKSEYEARLLQATDNYTAIKAENEVLKERVDILFKLGRSYLNKTIIEDKKHQTEDDKIEVVEETEDENIIENLQT